MTSPTPPLVHELSSAPSPLECFLKLQSMGGLIFFDSVTAATDANITCVTETEH